MSRDRFLGTTDLSTVCSLLNTYNVPTNILDCIKLHQIKQQDDLVLIELGTLLTSNECDQIVHNIKKKKFQNMSNKYNTETRNNARLIVIDDRFGRTLWRRLKFSHKLSKLIQNTKPLGFNVQGEWKMSGINPAMRINKYKTNHYFAPHKDAQYAPNGDERSLFSLIVYLNDNYEDGETKFYFPKIQPKSDIKGLTIKEEIESYNGLENGYECITIKPKKGHALLFTHNLLHEAISPKTKLTTEERIVLRSDVIVKRKDKPLGFAVCPEEQDDYLACLNFFRQAQQCELEIHGKLDQLTSIGELYERSLSIRYCYPSLLKQKLDQTMNIEDKQKALIDRLPPETWLHVFRFLDEQDVQHLIFAYPQFQLLKITWEAQEKKNFENDRSKLFILSFYWEMHEILQHMLFDTIHILMKYVKWKWKKLFSDVFYNRNCYGSLYRVGQKDEKKRQPDVDLNNSVDRTYMTNRHRSQFIGQDLLPRFHFTVMSNSKKEEEEGEDSLDVAQIRSYQRMNALFDYDEQFIDMDSDGDEDTRVKCEKDDVLGFREQLIKQTDQDSGASICRILSAENHTVDDVCLCRIGTSYDITEVDELINVYNHLVFDFDTHQLIVEQLLDGKTDRQLQKIVSINNTVRNYRVNIQKLAQITQGFNHASCHCAFPTVHVDQFSFLDYTYLSYVDLAITENTDGVFVLAKYDGIVAF